MNMDSGTFKSVLMLVLFSIASYAHASLVVVPANPLWTDTGISLLAGDLVIITASGTWSGGNGAPNVGPDGGPVTNDAYDEFQNFDSNDKGRLIGYVGADPFQGHWGDGTFFPQATGYLSIGSAATFTALTSGQFWLGINDDAVTKNILNPSDNSGQITADISVAPVPLPAALPLFSIGLTGLAVLARRKIGTR